MAYPTDLLQDITKFLLRSGAGLSSVADCEAVLSAAGLGYLKNHISWTEPAVNYIPMLVTVLMEADLTSQGGSSPLEAYFNAILFLNKVSGEGHAVIQDFMNRWRSYKEQTHPEPEAKSATGSTISTDNLDQFMEQLTKGVRAASIELSDSAARQVLGIVQQALLSSDMIKALERRGAQSEEEYLTMLMAGKHFRDLDRLYVMLAGYIELPIAGWMLIPDEKDPRKIKRERVEDITTVVHSYPQHVVLGVPGSGKSTVLRRIAMNMARSRLAGDQDHVPIHISLAEFYDLEDPLDFLNRYTKKLWGSCDLTGLLRSGRACFLLDGLNEMPFQNERDYRRRISIWKNFAQELPQGNQIIFTCRSLDYSLPLDLRQVEIEPLDAQKIQTFLSRYLPDERAKELWERINNDPRLLALFNTPYALWILTQLGGIVPENRSELFTIYVRQLLLREHGNNNPFLVEGNLVTRRELGYLIRTAPTKQPTWSWLPEDGPFIPALEQLGYNMNAIGQYARLGRRDAREIVGLDLPLKDREAVLQLACSASLLDETVDSVYFSHHLLQEYFAARQVVKRFRLGEDLSKLWQLSYPLPFPGDSEYTGRIPTTGWEETIILAAGLAEDERFVRTLLDVGGAVLAGRCLVESGLNGISDLLRKDVINILYQMMKNVDLTPPLRAAAGEQLDALGWLPDDLAHFVHIPPATELMVDAPGYEYWIARYPVTNDQFARFVKSDDYENPEHWIEGAVRSRKRDDWRDREKRRHGYPLVSIDVREAAAYAHWLTTNWQYLEEGRVNGPLPQDWIISIASVREWAWAAGGAENQRHPWGIDWDFRFANTGESKLNSTTPVAMYSEGASPFNILDLAGNIFEFARPTEETNRSIFLMGSSFANDHWQARVVGTNLVTEPDFNHENQGFRLVAHPRNYYRQSKMNLYTSSISTRDLFALRTPTLPPEEIVLPSLRRHPPAPSSQLIYAQRLCLLNRAVDLTETDVPEDIMKHLEYSFKFTHMYQILEHPFIFSLWAHLDAKKALEAANLAQEHETKARLLINITTALHHQGQLIETSLWQTVMDAIKETEGSYECAALYLQLADVPGGDQKIARQRAAEAARQRTTPYAKASILVDLARKYEAVGEDRQAVQTLEEVEKIVSQMAPGETQRELYCACADVYLRLEEFERARDLALALEQEENDEWHHVLQAKISIQKQKWSDAMDALVLVRSADLQLDALTEMVRALSGASLHDEEMTPILQQTVDLLLSYVSQINENQGENLVAVARHLWRMGQITYAQEVWEQCEHYAIDQQNNTILQALASAWSDVGEIDRAERIASKIKHEALLAEVVCDIGIRALAKEKRERAKELLEDALWYASRPYTTQKEFYDTGLKDFSIIFAATKLFDKALSIANRIKNPLSQARALNFLATTLHATGHTSEALLQWEAAYFSARQIGDRSAQIEMFSAIVAALKGRQLTERSATYLKALSESLEEIPSFQILVEVIPSVARSFAGITDQDITQLTQRLLATGEFLRKKPEAPLAARLVMQCSMSLALAYMGMQNQALGYLSEPNREEWSLDSPFQRARVLCAMGRVETVLDDDASAVKHLELAWQLVSQIDPWRTASLRRDIAVAMAEAKSLDIAYKWAKRETGSWLRTEMLYAIGQAMTTSKIETNTPRSYSVAADYYPLKHLTTWTKPEKMPSPMLITLQGIIRLARQQGPYSLFAVAGAVSPLLLEFYGKRNVLDLFDRMDDWQEICNEREGFLKILSLFD